MIITAKFPGGLRWRMTPEGVELEGRGFLAYSAKMLEATSAFFAQSADALAFASKEWEVPVELLTACAMTQSQGDPAKKFVWRSFGYFGDSSTPQLIAAGACRMRVSDVQSLMCDKTLDRFWLADVGNALRAAAAMIRSNYRCVEMSWDPVIVACAFNAGGLYEEKSPDNIWRLRQRAMLFGYPAVASEPAPDPNYAGEFSQYFAAAWALVKAGRLGEREFVRFTLPPLA